MKKGFVLLETIVVMSVLCTVLIGLYIGYSNMILSVKVTSNYNNVEYLYQTYIISNYLEKNVINEGSYTCLNCTTPYIFCNDKTTVCDQVLQQDSYFTQMIEKMKVRAIYITKWDTSSILDKPEIMNIFEATTQRYIKSLNPIKKEEDAYRIIVMFEEVDNKYQYASIEFSSNIRSIYE